MFRHARRSTRGRLPARAHIRWPRGTRETPAPGATASASTRDLLPPHQTARHPTRSAQRDRAAFRPGRPAPIGRKASRTSLRTPRGSGQAFPYARVYSRAHMTDVITSTGRATPLTANQIRGFWAAWGGWALDGMDSFIYSLVLVPALTELLPRSGIPATAGNIGFYGSVLFALFLIGWGLSMVWGPIADRYGRVRTLTLTILCYSLFTLLCGVATGIWQLAALRLLAGIGIGGEWAMG